MNNHYKRFGLGASVLLLAAGGNILTAQAPVTMTLAHTGAVQAYTVPPCAGNMTVTLWGAAGGTGNTGGSSGGNGGYVRGVITATPGDVLYFYVGGQGSVTAGGFNGGGHGGASSSSSGAGGGGASDIRLNGTGLANRIIVAAGGGGGGGNSTYSPIAGMGGGGSAFSTANGFGGAGGGGCASGGSGAEAGGTAGAYGSGGAGAGFTSGGGGGGQPSFASGGYGCNGALGAGGDGGGTSFICGGATGGVNGGGGGGGGYYGGGGGMTGTGGCNGGGGGGSSWAGTLFSSTSFSPGLATSHGSIVITFTFNGTPVAVTPTVGVVCLGNSTTLQGSGVNTYTWLPVGNFAGSSSSSVTINPSVTTNYTVSGTNNLGCISSSVITVNVASSSPSLTVTASSASVCLGSTLNLLATGAITYTWTNGITNGITFTPQATANYTVQGTNGCGTATVVTPISVAPIPVTISANPTLVCEGYASTLTAVSTAATYSWFPSPGTGSTAIVSPTSTSVYTVVVTSGPCQGISTYTLLTKTTPTITAAASNTDICSGDMITLTAGGAGANGTYSWSAVGGANASFTAAPATSSAYVVVGTNSLNCAAQAQAIVVVKPIPNLNIVASKTLVCSGQTVALTASGGTLYSWSGGPSTAGNTVAPTAAFTTYSVTGTHSVNLICTATKTIGLAVLIPTVVVSPTAAICDGETRTLVATGATSYTWNGLPSPTGQQAFSPTVTTTYTLLANTLSITTTCQNTATTQIVVNPNPTLITTATKTNNVCRGNTNTLTVSGASTYSWSGSTSTGTSIVVSPNATTTYTVAGTSAAGCTGTAQVTAKISACIGIGENEKAQYIRVFPNPNNGSFFVSTNEACHLKLFNATGQLVREIELSAQNNFKVELQDISSGLYYLSGIVQNTEFVSRITVQ